MSAFSFAIPFAIPFARRATLAVLTAGLALTGTAHAEGRIRIAEQFAERPARST